MPCGLCVFRTLTQTEQWRSLVSALISVCYRMSEVVSPVVQSSSPEGLIPMDSVSGNQSLTGPTGTVRVFWLVTLFSPAHILHCKNTIINSKLVPSSFVSLYCINLQTIQSNNYLCVSAAVLIWCLLITTKVSVHEVAVKKRHELGSVAVQ